MPEDLQIVQGAAAEVAAMRRQHYPRPWLVLVQPEHEQEICDEVGQAEVLQRRVVQEQVHAELWQMQVVVPGVGPDCGVLTAGQPCAPEGSHHNSLREDKKDGIAGPAHT
eukprot:scaffold77762_cov48-Phaeocystis_antarctica.AAC.6